MLLSKQALECEQSDGDTKAASTDNMAFCSLMDMDFERADSLYRRIYSLTRNEIYRLRADVGLMRVSQRTAANKEFYDHSNSAKNRIRRIEENLSLLDSVEWCNYVAAKAEYHIATSTYYYYLQQEEQSMKAIDAIDSRELLKADTATWLNYLYMKGSGGLCEGNSMEEVAAREADYLFLCLKYSRLGNYRYFEANTLQALAALKLNLNHYTDSKQTDENNTSISTSRQLTELLSDNNSSSAITLARQALKYFKEYGDNYQTAATYRTIASCLINEEKYAEAIDTLSIALEYVNQHHTTYYQCEDSIHLLPYAKTTDVAHEVEWASHGKIQTVPEWIMGIREQLSIAYSGLGMKEQSDYNRNIYLDLLEVVRQDKELENRYETLESEEATLNLLLWTTAIFLLIGVAFFLIFNMYAKKKNSEQTIVLRRKLDICQRILFGGEHAEDEFRFLCRNDEAEMVKLMEPYLNWSSDNINRRRLLEEEQRCMEKEHKIHLSKIEKNKRKNIMKRACISIVSDIRPYIDRLLNESDRLLKSAHTDKKELIERLTYMDELAEKIIDYNTLLASWIKMKHGTLKLHIENFALNELFAIVAKSRQNFEMKRQRLDVIDTNLWIKADKPLTLFMINTLLDNARKYTPAGGIVSLKAEAKSDGVEIVIEDNGPGIPEEDIERILHEKYYDASLIGKSSVQFEKIREHKGSGFGLMNCKSIVEKYKQTSELFKTTAFHISNRESGGCRISIRLPKGVKRMFSLLMAMVFIPSMSIHADTSDNDSLLAKASYYADQAYYCNVDRVYEEALVYFDSAMSCLNTHYLKSHQFPDSTALLTLDGEGKTAEIKWIEDNVDTDYYIILDIRNEAAVSFLALKKWREYQYNNLAYARLYKLISRDTSLEAYCTQLLRSSSAKTITLVLLFLLIIVVIILYYILYQRTWISHRINLKQIFHVNKAIFSTNSSNNIDEEDESTEIELQKLDHIPEEIILRTRQRINDIFLLDAMAIGVFDKNKNSLSISYESSLDELQEMKLASMMNDYYTHLKDSYVIDGNCLLIPLSTDVEVCSNRVGIVAFVRSQKEWKEDDVLYARLIVSFISVVIDNAMLSPIKQYNHIATTQDEARRAQYEEMQLYVQNTILDNSLSTFKHETLYYPSRVKQMLDCMISNRQKDNTSTLIDLNELISYYKEIYYLLSNRSIRQCNDVVFRRTTFSPKVLLEYARVFAIKKEEQLYSSGRDAGTIPVLNSSCESNSMKNNMYAADDRVVIGDYSELSFLMEAILNEAYNYPNSGELSLSYEYDNKFIRFLFIDNRRRYTERELNRLFTPDYLIDAGTLDKRADQISEGDDSKVTIDGVEYLICRQIIREHDEYLGYPGCRINAEASDEGGLLIWFTVPFMEIRSDKQNN